MAKRRKWSKKAKKLVKAYKSYKKKLEARVSRIVARGQTPIGGEALEYNVFKSLYESSVIEQKEKTYSSLTKEIISEQTEEVRWNKRYNAYLKNFYKRRDKLLEEGITPYDGLPKKMKDFKELYLEYKNDRVKEVEKGERASVGNISGVIISDQLYELSEEQAYGIFDYMKTLSPEEKEKLNFDYKNINAAIAKIRAGDFVREQLGLWNLIENKRAELFGLDKESKDQLLAKWSKYFKRPMTYKEAVKHEVSQTFYGSP